MRRHAGGRGSRNVNAALTEEQVRAILARQGTDSASTLATVYGCSAETIRRIWRGETWGWLDEEGATAAPPGLTAEEATAAQASLQRLQERLQEAAEKLPDRPTDMLQELTDGKKS